MCFKRAYVLATIILFAAGNTNAQNSVTLAKKSNFGLDISDVIQKSMNGESLSDSTLWLNYSTFVNPAEAGMSISAEIASGDVPEGIKIYLEALPILGSGLKNSGAPTGKVQLNFVPKVIIENIKTSFTGTGTSVGHQLIVTYEIDDFSKIQPGINSIYLQFTLK